MADVKSEVYYINHDPVLGWMSPGGQLIVCSYAEHEMAAEDIVQSSGWFDDWTATYMKDGLTYGDYLCLVKGYVLVDSHTFIHKEGLYPVCITAVIVTREQEKALWQRYFADAPEKAKSYFVNDLQAWQTEKKKERKSEKAEEEKGEK